MAVWKLDLVFQARGKGWVEAYYRDFGGGDFSSANDAANVLAQLRIAMAGVPVEIKGWRITDPLTPGRQGQSNYFNPVKTPTYPEATVNGSDPSTSINIAWLNAGQNLTRRTQLRGVWDQAIQDFGQLQGGGYGTWLQSYHPWRQYLLDKQYGWLHRPHLKDSVFVTYSYAADSQTPSFAFPIGDLDGIADGANVLVRFSRFNGSNSVLNRELVCRKEDAIHLVAAAPIVAAPMTSPGRAIIYGAPAFVTATNIGIERVGRRATGRPLLVTPGRSAKRKRT